MGGMFAGGLDTVVAAGADPGGGHRIVIEGHPRP